MSEFHVSAASSAYIQDLLSRYQSEPASVPPDWRAALDLITAYFPGALGRQGGGELAAFVRRYAHLAAQLDPLQQPPAGAWGRLQREVLDRLGELAQYAADPTVSPILARYAGTLTVETGHIDDPLRAEWICQARETASPPASATRRRALRAIIRAETFERFMSVRYLGKKRFGAEGSESLHALIERLLDRAAAAGVEEVVVGTMHRGRLGLMANLFGQPLEQLFARMNGEYPLPQSGRAADVPYHLGVTTRVKTANGELTVRLLPNPSHLEAINAVAMGLARCRQDALGAAAKVLPLIIHTDASVIAQGVVAEAIQFADLPGYSLGGVINIVVNNQLGFTTNPQEARSSRYCTGQWKAIDSLILHVNGDDVDAVIGAADLSFDFRRAHSAESVIDLVCVRRNGHNELDEPRFTQPDYYSLADGHPPISATHAAILQQDGVIDSNFVAEVAGEYKEELESAHSRAAGSAVCAEVAESDDSDNVAPIATVATATAAPVATVAAVAARIPPGDFNPKVLRLVEQRRTELDSGVAWATAELFAMGSILSTGWSVRFTGQDADRGAFSQRHLSLVDARSGDRHRVFEERPAGWGELQVYNSPLSEYAALSFEYGYSLPARRTLDIWEAQFGDFANGAQTVFDQFISSGQEKWGQHSGLVVLLPHGLEGQGPEHSSARIERMLHLAAGANLRIAHPSTSASYFHLLCSQIAERPRRPLIIFTPKKLLRLKGAMSQRESFESAGFPPVLVDAATQKAQRVLICSGKLYYDLVSALAPGRHPEGERAPPQGHSHITLIRLEQLYPFPAAEVVQALRSAAVADVRWVQEEPANYGAWGWLRSHLEAALTAAGLSKERLRCISRPENASPAGSFHPDHDSDQRLLVETAIGTLKAGLKDAAASV